MQNQLLTNSNEEAQCICALVEVISKVAGNRPWELSIDNQKMKIDKIRRISIDCFYEMVTGKKDAFYQICKQLPVTIDKLISKNITLTAESDTVNQELKGLNKDEIIALYLLAFSEYKGFNDLNNFTILF
jgi:type II restriction enzyme